MLDLLIFLLACYGVTNIITAGKIFSWIRDTISKLPGFVGKWSKYWIHCPLCMGVPVGSILYIIGLNPGINVLYGLGFLVAGFISSGFCWSMRVVMHRLGEDEL